MSPNKKAVIYCRVSTKEQVEEGNSLVSQERICRAYAEKYDYDLSMVFIEMGESAKTADRTELKKLLSFCSKKVNDISSVIVYKIDRLSRNTDDYSQIRLYLRKYGVEIKSATEHFEDNPMGRFMENIIANVAQFDNDMRTERSVGGMREAAREGRYVWSAPVGYANVKVNGKCTIRPNHMAPLVRKAFALAAEGMHSLEEVRNIMAQAGFLHNGKPYSRSYFYCMLENETYMGTIKKFGETHEGEFPPLVSELTFKQVHYRIHRRQLSHKKYLTDHPDFPLRRFIRDKDGFKITGSWAQGRYKKYPYYRFIKGKNFPKCTLENEFIAFMNSFGLSEEEIRKIKIRLHETSPNRNVRQRDMLNIKLKIEELKKEQQVLIQKNQSGIIPDSVLQNRLEASDEQCVQLKSIFLQMKSTPPAAQDLMVNEEFLRSPGTTWQSADLLLKKSLMEFLFPEGIIYDSNLYAEKTARLFCRKSNLTEDKSVRNFLMVKEYKALRKIFEHQNTLV